MPLTDSQIRNAKPAPKPSKLFDGGGLFLLVHPRGGKWWRFKYRFGGKEKTLSLGVYPDVSLSEARKKREEVRDLVIRKVDPSVVRREERARETAERHQSEAKRKAPRLSVALDGMVEVWKGDSLVRLTPGEAQGIRDLLIKLTA